MHITAMTSRDKNLIGSTHGSKRKARRRSQLYFAGALLKASEIPAFMDGDERGPIPGWLSMLLKPASGTGKRAESARQAVAFAAQSNPIGS
jgi:hypothetical protein